MTDARPIEEPAKPATRCGFVAIVGPTNAGKSTLLNRLVGAKVAIVSHKVQTTRTRITAIAIAGDAQLIFVDTPGIFQPKRRLDRAMIAAAWAGADDADVVVLLIDAKRGMDDAARATIERLKESRRPIILALNKVDLVRPERLLELTSAFNALLPFAATYMISALSGDGVDDLKADLAARLPPGPWHYPEDQLADVPMRQLAAEITREKIFERLHQELPYHSTVETEKWTERPDGSVRIDQVIFVDRAGHKGIVLGKNGATAKAIGAASRIELEKILERKVHLFLFVKVRPAWTDDPERYREMGLDFQK
jgi:GTP-binding protein Era